MTELSKKLPPLSTLVVFEAAYRLESFSRAADEVYLSQASISRQIRQLEANLGVTLFERQRHNVKPTLYGKEFAATVRLALNELANSAHSLRSRAQGKKTFTVFSDISIASALITPMLSEFQQRYPQLRLKVLSSYEDIEHTGETFDIGLQVGEMAQSRFKTEAVADDAIFPVCSPEFAKKLDRITPEQFTTLPLLHLEDAGRGWPDWKEFLEHISPEQNHRLRKGLTFTTYDVCLEVAAQGEGIALGWSRSVSAKISEGKLVRLSDYVMHLPNCVYIYRPLLSSLSEEGETFVRLLKKSIKPIEDDETTN